MAKTLLDSTSSAALRVVFAGTPDFAALPLRGLIEAGYTVSAVYTQPDRPSGRGRKLTPGPVKQVALEHGIEVRQPLSLRDEQAQADLAALAPDLLVVIAYGLILPQKVLDIPRLGCVNLHASLLPRWRGAAPIQRAIEAGDQKTGLCLMQMEAGLDTGPVLAQLELDIAPSVSGGELHDELMQAGAQALPNWLAQLATGQLQARIQDESKAVYAHKLSKAEARLDWSRSAQQLVQQIRAFDPWPGCFALLDSAPVKLAQAHVCDFSASAEHAQVPGQVLAVSEHGLTVACGQNALCVEQIQFPGARRMAVADAMRGHPLQGRRFD